jgi:hypothetical protein
MHSGGRSPISELSETCLSLSKTMTAIRMEDSSKGLSQLPSPAQSKPPDGAATDFTYTLGFFLVVGLGALLIVATWR